MDINLPLTQLLINGNSCFYVILKFNGIIKFANNYFLNTISDQQTIIGNTSFESTVEQDDRKIFTRHLNDIRDKLDSIKTFEINHRTLSGKTILIHWNIINKKDVTNMEIHCLGVESMHTSLNKEYQDLPDDKGQKLSELKSLNASLAKRAAELASSNEELERFAYVASHDLQEPLRMVSSFLQLLQRRYKDKLDAKANEYIHFAVDGAERMKTLILDLLKFSRVNTSKEEHVPVDLNEVCKNILLTYKQTIDQTKATVTIYPLPVISGSKTELVQLFQNLIGNALKYHNEKPPVINVKAIEIDQLWQFSIEDNGIGIDPRFFKKIFIIFQRLHHKNEYSGTGIGLAICKKIIERHGGSIWVESTMGSGSTFYFTISKNLHEQGKQSSRSSKQKKLIG